MVQLRILLGRQSRILCNEAVEEIGVFVEELFV